MPANTHIINKQVFEFECLHNEHAFQIKNRFGADAQHKISVIIDRACEQLDIENADIRIPQLEIDLGRISFDKLEQEIVVNFEKKFFEKLAEYKSFRPGSKTVLVAREESSLEIVKFFFLTGRLPWFAGKQDKNFLNDLFDEVFTGQYDAIRKFIFLNLENEKFIERLAGQADLPMINQMIQMLGISAAIFSDVQKTIGKIIEAVILLLKNNGNKDIWISEVIYTMQNNAAKQEEVMGLLGQYMEENQSGFFKEIQKMVFLLLLRLVAGKDDIYSIEIFFESIEKLFEEKFELSRTVLYPILLKEQPQFQNLPAAISNIKKELEKETTRILDGQSETDDVVEKKFYISNAGLILIASYFPVFFDQLKLLDGGRFTNKDTQVKAIFLLHYLCTGIEEAPEYILPLNKIVCGLSLEEPLPFYVFLKEEEKKECEELLNEVIYNWQKIGNSSIEALREAFINREAILSYENNGWKLQVERKGYDVLIDSLPWSFNHIKLSWMQEIITTEW
jgi:hypothetical protein